MKLFTAFAATKRAANTVNPDVSTSQNAKNILAKGTSFILGDAHFLTKSLADGIVKAESIIVNKLTGQDKDAIIEDRHNETEKTQENFKLMASFIKDEVRRGAKSFTTSAGKLTKVEPTFQSKTTDTFVDND